MKDKQRQADTSQQGTLGTGHRDHPGPGEKVTLPSGAVWEGGSTSGTSSITLAEEDPILLSEDEQASPNAFVTGPGLFGVLGRVLEEVIGHVPMRFADRLAGEALELLRGAPVADESDSETRIVKITSRTTLLSPAERGRSNPDSSVAEIVEDYSSIDEGQIPQFRDGGLIGGKGSPRQDANLIWASPREFIVNAESTANSLPWLEAINAGWVPSAAFLSEMLPGFANGGLVGGGGSLTDPERWSGLLGPGLAAETMSGLTYAAVNAAGWAGAAVGGALAPVFGPQGVFGHRPDRDAVEPVSPSAADSASDGPTATLKVEPEGMMGGLAGLPYSGPATGQAQGLPQLGSLSEALSSGLTSAATEAGGQVGAMLGAAIAPALGPAGEFAPKIGDELGRLIGSQFGGSLTAAMTLSSEVSNGTASSAGSSNGGAGESAPSSTDSGSDSGPGLSIDLGDSGSGGDGVESTVSGATPSNSLVANGNNGSEAQSPASGWWLAKSDGSAAVPLDSLLTMLSGGTAQDGTGTPGDGDQNGEGVGGAGNPTAGTPVQADNLALKYNELNYGTGSAIDRGTIVGAQLGKGLGPVGEKATATLGGLAAAFGGTGVEQFLDPSNPLLQQLGINTEGDTSVPELSKIEPFKLDDSKMLSAGAQGYLSGVSNGGFIKGLTGIGKALASEAGSQAGATIGGAIGAAISGPAAPIGAAIGSALGSMAASKVADLVAKPIEWGFSTFKELVGSGGGLVDLAERVGNGTARVPQVHIDVNDKSVVAAVERATRRLTLAQQSRSV